MRKLTGVLVVLLVVGASLMVATPAQSAGITFRGVITFDKNRQNPANSRLTWRLHQRQAGGVWKVVESRSWRSGSGMLGRTGTDSCVRNIGWLPNGTYGLVQHNDYPGSLIKGRAFRLDDKSCPNGTRRISLFIHTEQGARNRQCADLRGDQGCRWEFPRINDYKSRGCIKLAPRDLAELVTLYQRHFSAGVRHSKARVLLRVVD